MTRYDAFSVGAVTTKEHISARKNLETRKLDACLNCHTVKEFCHNKAFSIQQRVYAQPNFLLIRKVPLLSEVVFQKLKLFNCPAGIVIIYQIFLLVSQIHL